MLGTSHMKQHLVILCNNLDEAKNAASTLPNLRDLKKFFVFNFDCSNDSINWLDPNDDYISLGKVADLGNSAEICIRAAILYIVNWWHLIFCYGYDLPTLNELMNIRKTIDLNQGFIQESKCWAISKEHLLIFGLSKILGSEIIKSDNNDLQNELEIVKALRGEPSTFEAIKEAFIEVTNNDGMILQGSMPPYKKRAAEFIEFMTNKFSLVPEDPGVIFISPSISIEGFKMLVKQINHQTMIAVVEEEDRIYPLEPSKILTCKDEFTIKIFNKGAV